MSNRSKKSRWKLLHRLSPTSQMGRRRRMVSVWATWWSELSQRTDETPLPSAGHCDAMAEADPQWDRKL